MRLLSGNFSASSCCPLRGICLLSQSLASTLHSSTHTSWASFINTCMFNIFIKVCQGLADINKLKHATPLVQFLVFGYTLQVWLDASLPEHAIPEDPCQLPFPPEMPAVDLGPTINDALHIALPGASLCGRPNCSIQCKLQQRLICQCNGNHCQPTTAPVLACCLQSTKRRIADNMPNSCWNPQSSGFQQLFPNAD